MTPHEFWSWFNENRFRYLFINDEAMEERDQALEDLANQLAEYQSGLFFLIGGQADREEQDLIITSDGQRNLFPMVKELCDAAPKIEKWRVVAFKPALGPDIQLEYRDILFDPRQLWFIPLVHPDHPEYTGIRIGMQDYTPERENDFMGGLYLLLDNFLGEESFTLDVNYVECCELPEFPEEEGFHPLSELPSYIRWKQNENGERISN